MANYRSRKKRIDYLESPLGHISDQKGMIGLAVNFYKDLFAKEDRCCVRLEEGFWEESRRVTLEENESLVAPFSELEIKEAIFGCYPEGAPGPDGLSFLFYQKFWDIIKSDIVAMIFS